MSEVNVKAALRVWRRKYGEEKQGNSYGNTYWAVPINDRRRLVIIFLRWMRMRGLGEERFRKASFQTELIDICFGTAPAFNEKKRKQGHAALKEELEDILDTEGVFSGKRRKNNKNAKPFTPPTPSTPKAAPEVKEEKPHSDIKTVGRDITDKRYEQSDDEKPQLDPEWAKLMGVTQDE